MSKSWLPTSRLLPLLQEWQGSQPELWTSRCSGKMELLRHVSFVDCPGHDILMATMLNGAAVMDAALLLIAGNEPCPQPQTSEHLAAVEIMKLKHILILQNKIDLIKESAAAEQYQAILNFAEGNRCRWSANYPDFRSAPLQHWRCLRVHCQEDSHPGSWFLLLHPDDRDSFLWRQQTGAEVADLKAVWPVDRSSAVSSKLAMKSKSRPGIVTKDNEGRIKCRPSFQVVSLFAENNDLKFAVPGGLIGVGTKIDRPSAVLIVSSVKFSDPLAVCPPFTPNWN